MTINNRLNQLEMLAADETARKLSLRNAIDELVHEVRNRISEIDRLREALEYVRSYPFLEQNDDIRCILRTVDQALSNSTCGLSSDFK